MRLPLNKNKIENFAFNIDRPFSAQEASELCNVSFKKTQVFVKELRDEGKLEIQRKVHNKFFYVWKGEPKDKRTQPAWVKASLEGNAKADEVEDTICEKGYSSLRDIARQCDCSHEFVRQVVDERGLENINQKLADKKKEKAARKAELKALRYNNKLLKEQNQRPFLDSIIPFGVRG